MPHNSYRYIFKIVYRKEANKLVFPDLKPDNIILDLEDQQVVDQIVRDETEDPSPYKEDGDRVVYPCRNFGPYRKTPGRPKITDFGSAVRGDVSRPHTHPIQANLFQAPEVILQAEWTYSADIWNLGVMVSRLIFDYTLENNTLTWNNEALGSCRKQIALPCIGSNEW